MWRNALRNIFRTKWINNTSEYDNVSKARNIHKTSEICSKKSPLGHGLFSKIKDNILLIEAKQGPIGKVAVGIAQGVFTGGFVFGSGALIYYGFFDKEKDPSLSEDAPIYPSQGFSSKLTFGAGNVPKYVQDRINTSYMYLANSLGVSALGAIASFRMFSKPAILNSVAANPILYFGLAMGSQFLVTMFVMSMPYEEGFGPKQVGSILQAAMIGFSTAPLYLLGAQSIIRAGYVTAGIAAGLTGISSIVPNDSFVNWELPLRMGMYTVFLSFISLLFLPRNLRVSNLLYKVAMHGGLVVFPAYYLYNTKEVIQRAKFSSHFDPINSSMSLYTDVLNVYGRLSFLLPPQYFISKEAKNIPWAAQDHSKYK